MNLERALTPKDLGEHIRRHWSHGDDVQVRFGYAAGGKLVIFLYNYRVNDAVLVHEGKGDAPNDQKNKSRVQSHGGKRKKPVKAKPVKGDGGEKARDG